jgi:hypothetical protein
VEVVVVQMVQTALLQVHPEDLAEEAVVVLVALAVNPAELLLQDKVILEAQDELQDRLVVVAEALVQLEYPDHLLLPVLLVALVVMESLHQ